MVAVALPAGLKPGARPGPAFLFLAGAVLSALVVIYLDHPLISLSAAAFALPLGGWGAARLHFYKKSGRWELLFIGIALGLLVGGAQSYAGRIERAGAHASIPLAAAGRFALTLTEDSVLAKNGVRMYTGVLTAVGAKTGRVEASAAGAALVFAPGGPALFWGELVEVEGSIKLSDRPGGARFLIDARGGRVTARGWAHPLFAGRAGTVAAFLRQTKELGAPASSLFEALFLGVKDNLAFDLRDAFARTGSLHLLALSGLNVGMIAALILFFLGPLRSKKIKAVIALLLVGAFFFIAGPAPSLLRAVLMLALGTAGALLDREVDPLHVLFASAAVVLLFDPESVRSLSFQLSYLALFGILTLGRRLNRSWAPFLPGFARGLVAASLAAQVFTAPLLFAVFGVVYPIGLVVSLLLVPLTTVYIWSGTGLLAVSLIPWRPLAEAIRFLMDLQYLLVFSISDFFKGFPGIVIEWRDWMWLPAFAVWIVLALGVPFKWISKKEKAIAALAARAPAGPLG